MNLENVELPVPLGMNTLVQFEDRSSVGEIEMSDDRSITVSGMLFY